MRLRRRDVKPRPAGPLQSLLDQFVESQTHRDRLLPLLLADALGQQGVTLPPDAFGRFVKEFKRRLDAGEDESSFELDLDLPSLRLGGGKSFIRVKTKALLLVAMNIIGHRPDFAWCPDWRESGGTRVSAPLGPRVKINRAGPRSPAAILPQRLRQGRRRGRSHPDLHSRGRELRPLRAVCSSR